MTSMTLLIPVYDRRLDRLEAELRVAQADRADKDRALADAVSRLSAAQQSLASFRAGMVDDPDICRNFRAYFAASGYSRKLELVLEQVSSELGPAQAAASRADEALAQCRARCLRARQLRDAVRECSVQAQRLADRRNERVVETQLLEERSAARHAVL